MLAIFFCKVFKRVSTRFFDFRALLSVATKRKAFTCKPVFFIPVHYKVYERVRIDLLNIFVMFKIKVCYKARVRL
ncbi:hypothetical protein ALP35_200140 [Pseudomonas savastanoi pv. glycinea]|nr:hypothetical protein ALP35_200140 [Pseudomonas savastanoi pv. glycinea]